MFLLKRLKSDKVQENFVVFHYDGEKVFWCYATYNKDGFICYETKVSGIGCLLDMFKKRVFNSKVWLVGSMVYEMICWQGLYNQIDSGKIKLPKKINDDGVEVLSQALVTNEPTIIDLIVNKQKVHCVDFLNWGITKTSSLEDSLMSLQLRIEMNVKLEMGSLQDTAAAQGYTRLRRHDISGKMIYAHQIQEVRKLERDSWYGGRCECNELGLITEERWNFDVKSQYASFGLTKKFPTKLLDYFVEEEWKSGNYTFNKVVECIKSGLQVIAKVHIRTDSPIYPLRHNKLTVFPVGEFITTLASPELQLALRSNHVVRIFEWSVYECDTIFKENSQWFFDARSKLDECGLSDMAGPLKLSQNSGYSNIGRRGRKWINCDKVTDIRWGERVGRHPKTNELCMYRYIDGVNQYLDMSGEPDSSIPSIPATMFSYGRVDLLVYILVAGNNNWSYCDTDGIIVNRYGRDNLLTLEHHLPPRPGELVIREYSHDSSFKENSIDIRGVKYYRFGDTWRQAGVPSNSKRDLYGNVIFDQNTPFDISLRMGTPFIFTKDNIKRNWRAIYKHGLVTKDNRVKPFTCFIYKDKKTGEEKNEIRR